MIISSFDLLVARATHRMEQCNGYNADVAAIQAVNEAEEGLIRQAIRDLTQLDADHPRYQHLIRALRLAVAEGVRAEAGKNTLLPSA